jgi:hypothetical protein
MNKTGVVLAIILLVGIVVGLGYGFYEGYVFFSVQWGSLSNEWRAILIVVAAILAGCTLFLSLFVQSAAKKYGLKGSGKVLAYNDFLNWYSDLKNNPDCVVTPESFRQMTNQMTLWGSHRVVKQVRLLFNLLQGSVSARDQVLKNADLLYVEIRRDLGLTGTSGDSAIV